MFKDTQSYEAAIDRIMFLRQLEMDMRLSVDEAYELDQLVVAARMYEDALDAEMDLQLIIFGHNLFRPMER